MVPIDSNLYIPEKEIYIRKDAARHIFNELVKQIYDTFIKKMILTNDEQQQFKNETVSYM